MSIRLPDFARRHRKKLAALALALGLPTLAHGIIGAATTIEPPFLAHTATTNVEKLGEDLRVYGDSYARHRGRILEVRLVGSPEQVGRAHGRLLYPEMAANEGTLYAQFEHYVPIPPLRWLISDVSRVQFRGVDQGMTEARRREIAAEAEAFSPDPFASFLPTYHRFVFLQSLYDIALSFEHSPLLGCSSFALRGDAAADGHVLLARNFDFEAGPVFDSGKALFVMREEGRLGYASVAWPGLVGAVTGMNEAGVGLVVHGGRARKASPLGEPVVHTMRDVLGLAHSTKEAIALLGERPPMVSHIVFIADASGDVAIVERAPGEPPFVRRPEGSRVPITNHFEGPFESDPANQRVRAVTSTLSRRARLDEVLANLNAGASVQDAVNVLRDKRGPGGKVLPLGDRSTLDALIATHGVVMDLSARAIWVSEGPHLAGRFIRFDLARLFEPSYQPSNAEAVTSIDEDPILANGQYEAWVRAGSRHEGEHP